MSSSTCRSPCVRISGPARSWSLMSTAMASWNFSRKRTSSMEVSSMWGRPLDTCILEFFAKADVEHAGVQRAAPHTDVEPARAGKGSGGGTGENQIGGCGEHVFLQPAL